VGNLATQFLLIMRIKGWQANEGIFIAVSFSWRMKEYLLQSALAGE